MGSLRVQIWQAMALGAVLALLSGSISVSDALDSVNLDVMLFLFGMFVVGRSLEDSGYLSDLAYRLFRRAGSADSLVLMVLFVMGFASAFLMNDTVAVVGTPVVLFLARRHGINPKVLLLALAFAVTTGSVASPIGNPQNLLIALEGGVPSPFLSFARHLLAPTVINLLLAYVLLRMLFKGQFHGKKLSHREEPIKDRSLAALSKVSLAIILSLTFLKVVLAVSGVNLDFRLTYIALAAALPILLFSPMRLDVLRGVDWQTLLFFASMFILMESVWQDAFFQDAVGRSLGGLTSVAEVLSTSIVLSQFVSNVPLAALYLPALAKAGASAAVYIALAAGSTIAGNITVLGAASNVIVIQNAERRGETLTFLEFARAGIPLTIVNALVYWLFLA